MSTASGDQYYPGLEGVIASETAITNIEGKEGAGGLEYRGYAIEDLAGAVSYEETAFLLLHGDLPTTSQLKQFDLRLRSARAVARAAGRAVPSDPGHDPSDGCLADLGQRPGAF